MPLPLRSQFVLFELSGAAVIGGIAARSALLPVGVTVGVVLAALATVPVRGRWLYQVVRSWLGLSCRRMRAPGGVLGDHRVVIVPAGTSLTTETAAIRVGTTWSLPLELGPGGAFDGDVAALVTLLTRLLRVEDVPLASVRLLTATRAGGRSLYLRGQPPASAGVASRYCVLTLDTATAAESVAARGGTEAAVHNILRRCVMRAEQILSASGLAVRRIDPAELAVLLAGFVGPDAPPGSMPQQVTESWTDITVAGTRSMTFLVTSEAPDVIARLAHLSGSLGIPAVTTALVVARAERTEPTVRILLRLSSPGGAVDPAMVARAAVYARSLGLALQRQDGEQASLLRATSPLGQVTAA